MDGENDKPFLEKSPSFDPKATMDDDAENDKPPPADDNQTHQINNDNNDNEEQQPEKSDPDGVNNASSPKSPSCVDPEPVKIDVVDLEIKEEDVPAETKPRESSPLAPDLNKLSEEIDRYISSLSNSQGNESIPPDLPICVEHFMVLLEVKIEEYDLVDCPVKWGQLSHEESDLFLESVNRVSSLSKGLSKFSSDYKYVCSINRIQGVLQRAMSYVEEEFKSLLEDYKLQDSDSTKMPSNSNQESDQNTDQESANAEENNKSRYSGDILSDLIRLSKSMINGGYETECCQVYLVARRNVVEDTLNHFGFQKHSVDEVHRMHWESLEREIEAWIKLLKQCVVYFSNERKLCDTVFSNHSSISESLFGSLSHCVTLQILNFAEGVALTKRAPEKLFKFIDIYEATRDILPAIDTLFPEQWQVELRNEASTIRSHLGEPMILIFNELENSIKADSGKNQVPGGAVHPLTKYTMNYLEHACDYTKTLEQVFHEHQKIGTPDSATGSQINSNSQNQNLNNESSNQSPFQAKITKVIEMLDATIESRSKLYKDHALSSIFMMNNGRFILKKIRGSSGLNSLIGDTWYRKKSSEIRQYHKGYQRETWGKLLNCFNPEGLTVNGKVMKPALKERFKSFNAMFDDIRKTQSNWVVGDEQLQSELRVSISNMVIPAYRSFLGRYSQTFTPGRQTQKYVKYQPDDIESYVDELFDGTASSGKKKP